MMPTIVACRPKKCRSARTAGVAMTTSPTQFGRNMPSFMLALAGHPCLVTGGIYALYPQRKTAVLPAKSVLHEEMASTIISRAIFSQRRQQVAAAGATASSADRGVISMELLAQFNASHFFLAGLLAT